MTMISPSAVSALILALTLLAVPSVARAQDDLCTTLMKQCDPRFAGPYQDTVPVFKIGGKPDQSFTTKFVTGNNNGVIIGTVNHGSRAPDFIFKNKAFPITKFGFTPTHFKPFPQGNGTGVGHQTFSKAQLKFARYRCVRVWFSFWELYFPPAYELFHYTMVPPGPTDCIVFKTM